MLSIIQTLQRASAGQQIRVVVGVNGTLITGQVASADEFIAFNSAINGIDMSVNPRSDDYLYLKDARYVFGNRSRGTDGHGYVCIKIADISNISLENLEEEDVSELIRTLNS